MVVRGCEPLARVSCTLVVKAVPVGCACARSSGGTSTLTSALSWSAKKEKRKWALAVSPVVRCAEEFTGTAYAQLPLGFLDHGEAVTQQSFGVGMDLIGRRVVHGSILAH